MPTFLVSYDIPSNKRRSRVAKLLLRMGRRVQWSVFLVSRGTPEEAEKKLRLEIDEAEDNVRIHPLCANCEEKARLLGTAHESEPPVGWRVI